MGREIEYRSKCRTTDWGDWHILDPGKIFLERWEYEFRVKPKKAPESGKCRAFLGAFQCEFEGDLSEHAGRSHWNIKPGHWSIGWQPLS